MSFKTEPTNPRTPAPPGVAARPPRKSKTKPEDEAKPRASVRLVWASAQIQGSRDEQQDAIFTPRVVGRPYPDSAQGQTWPPLPIFNNPTSPNMLAPVLSVPRGDGSLSHQRALDTARGQIDAPFVAGVFDGMGGHEDGREHAVAAATVAETLTEKARTTEPAPLFLARILSTASEQLAAQFGRRNEFHGSKGDTTATLLHFDPVALRLTFGQVGDSAALLVRGSCFEIITPVHNLPFAHNRLTRALKHNGALPVDYPDSDRSEGPNVASVELEAGDVVLLCTDGLYQALNIADMGAALRELFMVESLGDIAARQPVNPEAVAQACANFLQRVLNKNHANQDNASLVLFVVEPARTPDAEGKP